MTDDFLKQYKNKDPNFGPIGKAVYERTYSRSKEDGTKEKWFETVNRVIDGNTSLVSSKHIEPREIEKLKKLMFDFKFMPAGRHIWVSGVKGRQYLFNCHTAGWGENVADHFLFTFNELMKGGGVGANYSNRYISRYPKVKHLVNLHIVCNPQHADYTREFDRYGSKIALKSLLSEDYHHEWEGAIRLEDSREGWLNALNMLLQKAFYDDGEPLVFDISLIRPYGAPIKGFGGTASGPIVLVEMLQEINDLLKSKHGEKLSSLDHMLIDHHIASCVVAGNVRRSARMAMKSWKDEDIFDFIKCKDNTGVHWSTNISVEIDDDFFTAYRKKDTHAKKVYNKVVEGMLTNGEPGFWNRSLSSVKETGDIYCTNPCGEISLQEWENCNLGHINLADFYNDETGMKEAFRLMTRYLIRATFGDITDPKQKEVVAINRRIGVGFFGFQEWLCKQGKRYSTCHSDQKVRQTMRELQNVVRNEARNYAFQLRIPEPIKVTTLAPTGTISQLPGVTAGAQCIYSRYFKRRVRYSDTDESLPELKKAGHPTERDVYTKNTTNVIFFCQDKLIEAVGELGLDESVVEQQNEIGLEDNLAIQAMLQKEYVDNSISFTINLEAKDVDIDEAKQTIIHYLPQLKGTTIMVDGTREQAPFERISREDYEKAKNKTISQGDMDCKNGVCPIK